MRKGSKQYDLEEAKIKNLKMKKIKIIANFSLVERLMLFAFNSIYDFDNVEAEYKAHIDAMNRFNPDI